MVLTELTNEALINLNLEAKDWEDAIRKSCQPLIDEQRVEERYVDAVIDNVNQLGPYIVITPHVALPHASPDSGVLETAIGIATLKHPIPFGNADNDPVKYLFSLSAKESKDHLEALAQLANLFEDGEIFKVLDEANSASDVYEFICKSEEGGK